MNQVVISFTPVPSYVEPEVPGPYDCQQLGLAWLEWVKEFSQPEMLSRYELILLIRSECSFNVATLAPWRNVRRIAENSYIEQYPLGPNKVFQQILWLQYHGTIKGPFLWVEPDCIPVKSNWLDLLAVEYQRGGKPFMGNIVEAKVGDLNKVRTPRHMTGNAIYPDKAYEAAPKLLEAYHTPWDVWAADQILPKCHRTELIQHEFRCPQLRTLKDLNEIIKPETALFHADKFCAIQRLMGSEAPLEESFSSVEAWSKKQPISAPGLASVDLEEILDHLKTICLADKPTHKKVAKFMVNQNLVNYGHVSVYAKGRKAGRPRKLTDSEFKARISSSNAAVALTDR